MPPIIIPSGARNLSALVTKKERFLVALLLGMTILGRMSANG